MPQSHLASVQKKIRKHKSIKNRNNRQKHFYSGKKKRHTIKSQIVVNKKTKQVVCTAFANGKCHDFKLFKKSKLSQILDIKVFRRFVAMQHYQKSVAKRIHLPNKIKRIIVNYQATAF